MKHEGYWTCDVCDRRSDTPLKADLGIIRDGSNGHGNRVYGDLCRACIDGIVGFIDDLAAKNKEYKYKPVEPTN